MGGLFSRAFKRITQGNQTQRSRNDSQSDQNADATRDNKRPARSLVESIPVGQSIDSAEYRALEGNKNTVLSLQGAADKENDFCKKAAATNDERRRKKDVEEAVIKIQALVRGHLTRKALKDANQPANGLGQGQFDEESLTKNPLSAIFSPSSLINNTVGELSQQSQQQSAGRKNSRTPLESIAEVVETTAASIGASVQQTATELAELLAKQAQADEEKEENAAGGAEGKNNKSSSSSISRQKLASICQSRAEKQQSQADGSTASRLESSLCESRDSAVSPVPSEANASIDLNTCDTPASASIDILDHNIRPIDKLATVLHPKQDGTSASATAIGQVPVEVRGASIEQVDPSATAAEPARRDEICTPDSLDSEEAAAIRIQSAFRGYRTRKNSPYRTRSPNSITDSTGANNNANDSNKRDLLVRQQAAVDANDDGEEGEGASRLTQAEELEAEGEILAQGRRESRSKQRDIVSGAGSRSAESIGGPEAGDAPPTTEETSIATIREVPSRHNIDSSDKIEASEPTATNDAYNVDADADADETRLDSLSEATDKLHEATIGLSAALESGPPSDSANAPLAKPSDQSSRDQVLAQARKISIGAKSDASFDTDSSVLGAALSLNDETSTSVATTNPVLGGGEKLPTERGPALGESVVIIGGGKRSFEAADDEEDTVELESEARRLVEELHDEMREKDHNREGEKALGEATNQLEAALEEASATDDIVELGEEEEDGGGPMNVEEQLAIELESDDIERRDPRGQASEERARSPQISTETEPIELVVVDGENRDAGYNRDDSERPDDENNEPAADEDEIVEAVENRHQLMAKSPDQATTTSGRSSPALDSSNGEDSDDNGQQQNQKAQPTQSGSKNKKRNRNKRRGKK